jgi:hypothetical protein
MLSWGAYSKGVVMLWWMFDESYQHSKETGHASLVTVAGCAATAEDWYSLTLDWAAALEQYQIPAFHMTDFEANRGEFDGWEKTPDRRRSLLSSLLDTAGRHVHHFWGVARRVDNSDGSIAEAYRLCVDDMVKDLARDLHFRLGQKFALVFARHRNFDPGLVRQAIERQYPERFGSVSSDDPNAMCPLQVADLVAFEVRCKQRDRDGERYPFRRLRDAARAADGTFSLSWH